MTTPIVDAQNISKTFGRGCAQVRALNSVSLSLETGALTLLMGPSGSGKTTLLAILGCMLTPDSGTVRIAGSAIEKAGAEKLAEIRRRWIGFVFQSYHLFPTLTAAENVQLALDIRSERGRKARAKSLALLERIGLANRSNAFPRQLSGGEQQRVAIARAIVASPALILADEPTAALDGDNGRAIMAILAELARDERRAVLVVTHDPRVLPFADRIIQIEDGSLWDAEKADISPFSRRLRAVSNP